MDRTHPFVIPGDTPWLSDPGVRKLGKAFDATGFAIYVVGGAVRNALLGLPGSDVDMSTNALPDQVTALAAEAGFKVVPTGIDHGTVTVISEGTPFEVTTFRRDVETDGRRAVVAFSDRIEDDARRRDFTMNALYADLSGKVIDPLGGLPDLLARRVRFIEDPDARIREDYLRILRFFRFSAWYSDPDQGFDPDTLDAIARNLPGLETLSAERVGQEMSKLLAAPDPAPALATMRQINVLPIILPGSDDRFIAPLVHLETALAISPDWITRLAALGGSDAESRLRLSRADARKLATLREAAFGSETLPALAFREGVDIAQSALVLRCSLAERMPETAVLETIKDAAQRRFPVAAKDLMPEYEGAALGARLRQLEEAWIASGFTLSRDDLLALP